MKLVRSALVAAAMLGTGVASAAANTINPTFVGTTNLGGGIYRWDYSLSLDAGRLDADGNGPTTPTQFFTFYDIRGYVLGSESASASLFPTRWVESHALLGATPPGVSLDSPDNPLGMNVTFDYISTAALSNQALGTFSFQSTFDQPDPDGVWSSRDLQNTGTNTNRASGSVEMPTPDGGSTAALLGSVLFAFGVLRRRFSKG